MLTTAMPSIDIGPHCFDPYECSFHGHCWQHIPSPSVFDFADIGKPDAFALYMQGIVKMQDVPTDELGWRQLLQFDGVIHKKNHFDNEAVTRFLGALWYPLAFLDFETTCLTAIPLFDGTRPFQAVPFQYSLHVQKGDEKAFHQDLARLIFTIKEQGKPVDPTDIIPSAIIVPPEDMSFEEGQAGVLRLRSDRRLMERWATQ